MKVEIGAAANLFSGRELGKETRADDHALRH